jgi:phage host-nuclease inhibitor protein Gam
MNENTRELDQIQLELDRLHERSQDNKANISAHEAVCEERYAQIMAAIIGMRDELQTVHSKLNSVSDLASQGKTSLKTLLWVGGLVAGITAFLATIINFIPK